MFKKTALSDRHISQATSLLGSWPYEIGYAADITRCSLPWTEHLRALMPYVYIEAYLDHPQVDLLLKSCCVVPAQQLVVGSVLDSEIAESTALALKTLTDLGQYIILSDKQLVHGIKKYDHLQVKAYRWERDTWVAKQKS